MHLKLAETEEDDLRALIEPDFHQRIIARHRRNHGVNASCLADPLPVDFSEVVRLLTCVPHGNGLADKNCRALTRPRCIGGRGFVRAHRAGFESGTSHHLERQRHRLCLSQR